MDIYYKQEHLNCQHYTSADNASFIIKVFKKGDRMQHDPEKSVIVFLQKGILSIIDDKYHHYTIADNQMWFTYRDTEVCAKAESDGWLITCHISSQMNLCNRFTLQQLAHSIDPNEEVPPFYQLPIHPRITEFLTLLKGTLEDGVGCLHYHVLKLDELMIYLRLYYNKVELARFFHQLAGANLVFKEFVLDHYKQVRDIKELAQKANLSISTFNRRFKETFHESPQKWMITRRSENILRDIFMSELSFSEIADKYGLSSAAYLTTFCKKHYGKTPNSLREEGPLAYSHTENEQQM